MKIMADTMESYNLRSKPDQKKHLNDRFNVLDQLIWDISNETKKLNHDHLLATCDELTAIGRINIHLKTKCEKAIGRLQRCNVLAKVCQPDNAAELKTESIPEPQLPDTPQLTTSSIGTPFPQTVQNGVARSQSTPSSHQQAIILPSTSAGTCSYEAITSPESPKMNLLCEDTVIIDVDKYFDDDDVVEVVPFVDEDIADVVLLDEEDIADVVPFKDEDIAEYLIDDMADVLTHPQPFPEHLPHFSDNFFMFLAAELKVSVPDLITAMDIASTKESQGQTA